MRLKESKGVPYASYHCSGTFTLVLSSCSGRHIWAAGKSVGYTETEKATVGLSQWPLKDLISFLIRRNKKNILYHLLNHYIYVQLFKLVLDETEQGTQDRYECSNTSLKKRQLSFHGWSVLSQRRQ